MSRLSQTILSGFAALALASASCTWAAAPAASPPSDTALPSWSALPQAEHELLVAPVVERWNQASPAQRQRMLDRARTWGNLNPEQRAMARRGAERYREASVAQRESLRDAWQRIQKMPPAERETAREAWRKMGPRERRAWLDAGGPGVVLPPEVVPTPVRETGEGSR